MERSYTEDKGEERVASSRKTKFKAEGDTLHVGYPAGRPSKMRVEKYPLLPLDIAIALAKEETLAPLTETAFAEHFPDLYYVIHYYTQGAVEQCMRDNAFYLDVAELQKNRKRRKKQ